MFYRWDPFFELTRLPSELARAAEREAPKAFAPPVDVFEDEAAIVVRAELPGVRPDEVSITVEKNVLTLEGERRVAPLGDKETCHRAESPRGAFKRVFTLPKSVDESAIDAKLELGVLTVRLPKREAPKPRKIAVKVEGAGAAA